MAAKTVAKHDELKLDSSDPATILVGALSSQQAGGPLLPKTRFKNKWENDRFTPRVAHMQLDTFPDDPIAFERTARAPTSTPHVPSTSAPSRPPPSRRGCSAAGI